MTQCGGVILFVAGMLSVGGFAAAQTLKGGGATFPAPLYQKWFTAFEKRNPAASLQYQEVGSGTGIDELARGEIDFAGSDIPLTNEQLAMLPRKARMIPTVMGGVVPIYHLDGVLEDLRFTPSVLAGIYLGKITSWNDPAIRAANGSIALPARKITVIHRSDRSGTTFVWTDYLSKISTEWKSGAGTGDTVAWPVGVPAIKNEGVAQAVAQTPDSIGYVEFIFALQNRLSYGWVRNRAGRFVQASLTSVPAAAAEFTERIEQDFRVSITNAPGRDSYPIASLTYLLVPEEFPDPQKQKIMKEFLVWMLTTGQKQCAALGYAPLPAAIAEKARRLEEAR